MIRTALLSWLILLQTATFAQQAPPIQTDTLYTKPPIKSLLDAFEQGRFHGSFRTFFMATDNTRQLKDYHAWAGGGTLHFSSAPWHGFNFGLGGVFNFNLSSSDLGAKDATTGASNRYEIGLFDVQNPENKADLDRMEAFWLRYQSKKWQVTVGQQSVQTPFINHQDGRMRPTAVSGVWFTSKEIKNTRLEGGWLHKISPRSTVAWYSIGESIGLYPKGLNPDGSGSGYPEHLESMGIGLLGVTRTWGRHTRIQLWNQYVENIFNTALIQADFTKPLRHGHQLLLGIQFTHQDALADGGNPDAGKTYFTKNSHSNAISTQVGWQRGPWKALAAYTHITDDGRFLSPREWGREPFYTFLSRERIEGSGDVHAIAVRLQWQSNRWQTEAAFGHYYLPDVKAVALNKYTFPAFKQLNFDVRYRFGGMFKGLHAQLLYVWKGRLGEVYGNDRYVINRVNMAQYNLILNYTY
jgi:hypothetical protein